MLNSKAKKGTLWRKMELKTTAVGMSDSAEVFDGIWTWYYVISALNLPLVLRPYLVEWQNLETKDRRLSHSEQKLKQTKYLCLLSLRLKLEVDAPSELWLRSNY